MNDPWPSVIGILIMFGVIPVIWVGLWALVRWIKRVLP